MRSMVAMILAITVMSSLLIEVAGCSSAPTPSLPTPPPSPETTIQTPNPEPSREPAAANATTENTPPATPSTEPKQVSAIEVGPQVGKLAPDFTFIDSEGKSVSLSDLRGSSIILNFWATWCGPCKYEMPLIQDLAHDKERAEKGLIILTINIGESADTILKFMKARSFSFPVLLDIQKSITRAYNVRAIPTTFFIGQDGIISEIKVGAFMNESELEQSLNRFIK